MKCPHCAEDILAEARVCKHCGRRVGPSGIAKGLTIILCVACGLFLLILVLAGHAPPPKEQTFEDLKAACQRDMPYDVDGCVAHIVLKRAEDVRQQSLEAAERDARH